jgi:adenylyltransferase/sulfurtransferase
MHLAAAGVGTLGVVDDDIVSLSNLQRQIIHATPISAAARSTAPRRKFTRSIRMSCSRRMRRGWMLRNAMSLIGGYDLVLDGSDNFETRYLVSDACFLAAKPLIAGARRCSTDR